MANSKAGTGGRWRALVALLGGLALVLLSIRPAVSVQPWRPGPGEAGRVLRTEAPAHGGNDRSGFYAVAPSEEITHRVYLPVVLNRAALAGETHSPTPTGTPTGTPTATATPSATPSATVTLPPGALPDLIITNAGLQLSVSILTPAPTRAWAALTPAPRPVGRVLAAVVLRAGPASRSPEIAGLVRGTEVEVIEQTSEN